MPAVGRSFAARAPNPVTLIECSCVPTAVSPRVPMIHCRNRSISEIPRFRRVQNLFLVVLNIITSESSSSYYYIVLTRAQQSPLIVRLNYLLA